MTYHRKDTLKVLEDTMWFKFKMINRSCSISRKERGKLHMGQSSTFRICGNANVLSNCIYFAYISKQQAQSEICAAQKSSLH